MLRTYWPDLDADGFGDPLSSIQSCEEEEGYINNNQDCDDSNPDINPFAEEICDEIDNNCNFSIDEGCGEEPVSEDTAEPEDTSAPEDPEDSAEPEDTAVTEDSAEPEDNTDSGIDTSAPKKGDCSAFPVFFLLLFFRKMK